MKFFRKHCKASKGFTLNRVAEGNSGLGFTLVEAIVAITIFLTTVSASVGIFSYALKAQRSVVLETKIAENVRLTLELMTRKLRTAEPGKVGTLLNGPLGVNEEEIKLCIGKLDTNGNPETVPPADPPVAYHRFVPPNSSKRLSDPSVAIEQGIAFFDDTVNADGTRNVACFFLDDEIQRNPNKDLIRFGTGDYNINGWRDEPDISIYYIWDRRGSINEITDEEVARITDLRFRVVGAPILETPMQQARITIFLVADEPGTGPVPTSHRIPFQTTVTMRELDT